MRINLEETKLFLQELLPELQNDEVFIYFVFARKKYCPHVKNHHQMLYRNIFKDNNIELMARKLELLRDFFDYDTLRIYNENCLATYIDLHPKSTLNAYIKFQNVMNTYIKRECDHFNFTRIKNKLMSSIHKSTSRKPYIMIDIDTLDESVLNKVLNEIPEEPKWVTQTRGGFHAIYNKNTRVCKVIYTNLIKNGSLKDEIEIKSNVMTPIVGTFQGGKRVKKFA